MVQLTDSQLVEIGKKISEKRIEKKFSQAEMAEKLQQKGVVMTQKMYSNYEIGRIKNPKPFVIAAFGEILDMPELPQLYFPAIENDDITTSKSKEYNESSSNKKIIKTLNADTLNEDITMGQLTEVMLLYARAQEKDAEARLYDAKTRDRLSSVLDRLERKLEGEDEVKKSKVG